MTTTKIETVAPLNQIVFKHFLADELTVKQVKALETQIASRFNYIVHKIAEITQRQVDWYDYDNTTDDYDYNSHGEFDTDAYKQNVGYTGEFSTLFAQMPRFEGYDNEFPTKWFYSNFEVQVKNERDAFLNEQKRLEDEKIKGKNFEVEEMQKVRESIMKKLSPEELAYISFVKLEDVRKNKVQAKAKVSKTVACEVSVFIKEMKQKGISVSGQYQQYRDGKKKPKSFETWVLKNMEKIRANANVQLTPVTAWPFPTQRD